MKDNGTITFYQIRLSIGGADVITSPWGHASTGLTGRYLFSPDMGWHYCSAERLLTFELLDVDFEREGRMEESDEEAEWWFTQADEALHTLNVMTAGDTDLTFSSRDVIRRNGYSDNGYILIGRFVSAVESSDVMLKDDGDERPDSELWDEAREYACGNHFV